MDGFTSRKSHSRKTKNTGRTNIRQHPMKIKNNTSSMKKQTEGKTDLQDQRHKKIAELEAKKGEKHIEDKTNMKTQRLNKKAELDTLKSKEYSDTKAKIEVRNQAKRNPDPRKSITVTGINETKKSGSPVANTGRKQQSESTKFNTDDQPYRELQKNMEKIINKK